MPILRGARILVVDDDDGVLDAVRRVLEGAGAIVAGAESLELAVAELDGSELPPDAVLIDLLLGDGWGLQLVDSLSSSKIRCAFSVMTGNTQHAEFCLLRAGAVDVVFKPVDVVVLLQAMAETVARTRKVRERVGAARPRPGLVAMDALAKKHRTRTSLSTVMGLARVRFGFRGMEADVVRLLSLELSDREIAERLEISEPHAKRIEAELRRKTGAKTRLGIVRACYELLCGEQDGSELPP